VDVLVLDELSEDLLEDDGLADDVPLSDEAAAAVDDADDSLPAGVADEALFLDPPRLSVL
jgi:hypothetical protein